jgi:hypothetical protein
MIHHKRSHRGCQSNNCHLLEQNDKEMWANVTFIWRRQTNPRKEIQLSQRRQFNEFAWNWTRELIKLNGKEMWASMTFIRTSQTNPRAEPQRSQQGKFSEFARNWTRELIKICSNRMARKCEHGWHSCQQDKPMYIRNHSSVNNVPSPSSLGIEPVSWL